MFDSVFFFLYETETPDKLLFNFTLNYSSYLSSSELSTFFNFCCFMLLSTLGKESSCWRSDD